jgi:hypothetical protein
LISATEVDLVYLAYIDDSGSGDKQQRFQLMTGIVIADHWFREIELLAAGLLHASIPKDKSEKFQKEFKEFKGWQLFRGHGPFEGIDEPVRFRIIEVLLALVRGSGFPVIFGALDKPEWELQKSGNGPMFAYGGASADDICFRCCIKGIGDYIAHNKRGTFALLIADDYKDIAIKDRLRAAFYAYRERVKPMSQEEITGEHTALGLSLTEGFTAITSDLPALHDDMYFGDSRYSIGIQLADLCGYIIAKHLANDSDPNIGRFYKIMEGQIMYSVIEPGHRVIHPEAIIGSKTGKDIRIR